MRRSTVKRSHVFILDDLITEQEKKPDPQEALKKAIQRFNERCTPRVTLTLCPEAPCGGDIHSIVDVVATALKFFRNTSVRLRHNFTHYVKCMLVLRRTICSYVRRRHDKEREYLRWWCMEEDLFSKEYERKKKELHRRLRLDAKDAMNDFQKCIVTAEMKLRSIRQLLSSLRSAYMRRLRDWRGTEQLQLGDIRLKKRLLETSVLEDYNEVATKSQLETLRAKKLMFDAATCFVPLLYLRPCKHSLNEMCLIAKEIEAADIKLSASQYLQQFEDERAREKEEQAKHIQGRQQDIIRQLQQKRKQAKEEETSKYSARSNSQGRRSSISATPRDDATEAKFSRIKYRRSSVDGGKATLASTAPSTTASSKFVTKRRSMSQASRTSESDHLQGSTSTMEADVALFEGSTCSSSAQGISSLNTSHTNSITFQAEEEVVFGGDGVGTY